MSRVICSICKLEIIENERIVLSYRLRGKIKTIENYHTKCWDKIAKEYLGREQIVKPNHYPGDNVECW